MKRTTILKYYTYFCILIFFMVFGLYFISTGKIFPAYFSLFCLIVGSWSLVKSFFFHLDSNFWFGITLGFIGIIGILNIFIEIKQENLFALYWISTVYASLFTGIFYKKLLHYKISFVLLLEDFLILVYSNNILTLYGFIATNIVLLTIVIGGIYVYKRNKRIQQKRSGQKN